MPARTGNSSHVVLPPPKKKIMAIVDPDTKEEIKVSKADVSVPSHNPASTKHSASPPIKVEPRPSRPLAVLPDPSDTNSVPFKPPSADTSATAADDAANANDSNPKSSEAGPESSQQSANVHGVDDTTQASPHRAGTELPASVSANTSVNVKDNVSAAESDVPKAEDSNASAVTPSTKNLSDSETQPSDAQSTAVSNSETPSTTESLQAKDLPSTMDSSVSFVTNQSGDSASFHGPSDSVAHPVLPDNNTTLSASSETMEPNGDFEKGIAAVDEPTPVEPSTRPPLLPARKEGSQQAGTLESEDDVKAEGEIGEGGASKMDQAASTSTDASSSSEDEMKAESSLPESQVLSFAPGQRRVYAPEFLLSLRSSANQQRVAEFKSSMTSMDIFGSSRSASTSSSRLMSSGSGPLSSDPRGTRAFPPHSSSGFQMGPIRGPPLSGMMAPGGFHDGSDIRAPRFAPPPVSRSSSVRDGDPRGSRTQRPNQRGFDGFIRRGQMPVEAAVPQPPVEKLKRSATGWHRNKEADDEITAKVKQVRSLLNKLTLEKFDRIFAQIVAIDLSSYDVLVGVVKEIFEKTLFEPKFSDMYAELCSRLDVVLQPILSEKSEGNDQLNFRRILLNNCKEEFVRFANSSKPVKTTPKSDQDSSDKSGDDLKSPNVDAEKAPEETDLEKEEADLKASNAKRRMLANVRFIGELFLKDLLSETIIHKQCIQKLLQLAVETKEEDVLEALCKLLSKTGAKLSANINARDHIERYFMILVRFSRDQDIPARIRFMIQDLLEQRENGWKVRREEAGAKTIAEIHQDVEKEEKSKADAANALRDRRSRGGGSGRHVNSSTNYQPRVAMMMASRPNSTPGMSRTNMTLEKLNNVKTSGLGASSLPQGMRLGPSGRGMASAGSGAPSLRPNGSRSFGGSRYSLLSGINASDVAPADENSGDVRRSDSMKSSSGVSRPVSEPGTSSAPKAEVLDPSVIKRKAKSILEEYWAINDLNEATSCLEEEVKSPNYSLFMEEAIKLCLEAKIENCQKGCVLFSAWIGSKTVPARKFLDGLKKFGPLLEDIEMDFPLVAELYAKLVYTVSMVPEFKEVGGGKYGLTWVKTTFDACDEKKTITKFVVKLLGTVFTSSKDKSVEERQSDVLNVYKSMDIDLAAELSAWDDMMGPRTLRGLLDRSDLLFIVETIDAELQLRGAVEAEPTVEGCVGALRTFKGSVEGESGKNLMRTAIRVGLDSVFVPDGNAKELMESSFEIVAKAARVVFGKDISHEAQLAALLEIQLYMVRNRSRISQAPKEYNWVDDACRKLYTAEVVLKNQFLEWKSENQVSGKSAGKEQMIKETEVFFKWLEAKN